MSALRRFLMRLVSVVRSGRAESDLAREIETHLQLLEDEFRASGMSAREARDAARRAFGGVEQAKEHQRDARSFRWIAGWPMDLKLGVRMLARSPGLTVIGVAALAVAIGSGAAYLEFVNDMFRPRLPLPQGARVVSVLSWDVAEGEPEHRTLYDFARWRSAVRTIEDLGAYVLLQRNLITDDGRAEPVDGVEISASAFRVAPQPPLLGRPLLDSDEAPGAPPVVVIGHDLWQSRFEGAADIIGRTVRIGRVDHTVVGVMPAEFGFPVRQRLWVPLTFTADGLRRSEGPRARVFGRLAPGVRIEAAQAELDAIGARVNTVSAANGRQLRPRVMPYVDALWSSSDGTLQAAILYSVNLFFVGLLALCGANVATLVFARTATRAGEIAVRTALGASRGRIVAQLFAEALVLASIGAIAGLAVARYGAAWIRKSWLIGQGAQSMPFWWNDALTPSTVIYAGALTLLAAAIVGIVPALKATGPDMQGRLKEAAAGGSRKFSGWWTAVVVGQVAVTTIFFASLLSLSWSLTATERVVAGFRFPAGEILALALDTDRETTRAGTSDEAIRAHQARLTAGYRQLEERLSADPAVKGVTYADTFPGRGSEFFLEIEGVAATIDDDDPLWVRTAGVAADYFETFGVPILAGRPFTPADVSRQVAIVDDTFVRHVLGGRDPVGLRVRQPRNSERPEVGPWYEIIGVAGNISTAGDRTGEDAILYRPIAPGQAAVLRMFVRGTGDPSSLASMTRRAAVETDASLRLSDVLTLDRVEDAEIHSQRFFRTVVALFGAIALMLATAGIYALMTFTVARRSREISIRVALGAAPERIVTTIFSRVGVQVAVGLVLGSIPGAALLSLGAGQGGSTWPWRVAAGAAGSAAFVLLVSALACVLPAMRALRIDPADALKTDH